MLFHRWNSVENESWADVCLTTLFQRWNTVDRVTLIQCWWPNVVSALILGWKGESKHVHQCRESSIETTLSIFVVLRFTRMWLDHKTKLGFQVYLLYSFCIKTWSNYSFNCNEMILLDRIYIKHIKFFVKYYIRNIINTKFQFQ